MFVAATTRTSTFPVFARDAGDGQPAFLDIEALRYPDVGAVPLGRLSHGKCADATRDIDLQDDLRDVTYLRQEPLRVRLALEHPVRYRAEVVQPRTDEPVA